jgi:hypothetical protein
LIITEKAEKREVLKFESSKVLKLSTAEAAFVLSELPVLSALSERR